MRDRYGSFAELERHVAPDDYRVRVRDSGSRLAIVAPHGGGIEPGTSEIALAIAGDDLSYYLFEGRRARGNRELHLTSTRFDEPRCLALIATVDRVVTVHGERGERSCAYVGGRDEPLRQAVGAALRAAGFTVDAGARLRLDGLPPDSIVNLGASRAGVQLELSHGLRRELFASLSREGRLRPSARLAAFGAAVRTGLEV